MEIVIFSTINIVFGGVALLHREAEKGVIESLGFKNPK